MRDCVVVSRPAAPHRRQAPLASAAMILGLWLAGDQAGMVPAVTAQDLVPPPIWAFNDLACAPFLTTEPPTALLRVVGSQDTVVKYMLGPGDTLVISGGASAGLATGQEYYVRRLSRLFGARGPDPRNPLGVHTAAWVRILGVDANVATASIVHACEGILLDDYLEPFSPPMVASRTLPGGTTQYENMGRIVMGDESRGLGVMGDLLIIDRGSSAGVVPGQRFFVFRDKRGTRLDSSGRSLAFQQATAMMPLVEIGEVVAMLVRPMSSTVQVVSSRDAVQAGDLIAAVR
jgi:hypothetical protein